MGSRFEIIAVHESENIRHKAINDAISEIQQIETPTASWKSNPETSSINQNTGIKPVKISEELFNLIERSRKVSELTNGAFDIYFASIDPVWILYGSEIQRPDSAKAQASFTKINYQNIILDRPNLTVFLKKQVMKIGFIAMGKGYAAKREM
jgi:thiamine biosynthesis lipoprotein